jgi:hypothetical protein
MVLSRPSFRFPCGPGMPRLWGISIDTARVVELTRSIAVTGFPLALPSEPAIWGIFLQSSAWCLSESGRGPRQPSPPCLSPFQRLLASQQASVTSAWDPSQLTPSSKVLSAAQSPSIISTLHPVQSGDVLGFLVNL